MSWWGDQLVPELRDDARKLEATVRLSGASFIITSVRRSLSAERRLLRSAGVEPDGLVSAHHFGRAFDVEIKPAEALQGAVALWRYMGHKWSPYDPVHFEG
jgi:hypothetical protein